MPDPTLDLGPDDVEGLKAQAVALRADLDAAKARTNSVLAAHQEAVGLLREAVGDVDRLSTDLLDRMEAYLAAYPEP